VFTIARAIGDRKIEATGLNNIAFMLLLQGNLEASSKTSEDGLSLAREIGDKYLVVRFLIYYSVESPRGTTRSGDLEEVLDVCATGGL